MMSFNAQQKHFLRRAFCWIRILKENDGDVERFLMLLAIDIDQTICGSNAYEVYAHFHTVDLGLQIEPAALQQLSSYRDFFFLPQVRAFRQANEKEWNASRHRAIATPWVIEAFAPIERAVQGVKLLSQLGTIRYYTARTAGVREATERWLARYDFPEHQNVLCCSSIEQKARVLAGSESQDETIILIDDRGHSHFLTSLERLKADESIQALLPRLSIFAFGIMPDSLPHNSCCSLFALPSWYQSEEVTRRMNRSSSS